MFASEHFDFTPDILTSAKGIASGLPLSATIARADLMKWGPGAHASTFGDRTTREPHPDALAKVEMECFKRGLITLGCGVSAIRLSPPLVIDRDQCDFALKTIDEALSAAVKG
jgi:4-aminobutyrate aminotransferase-like enzyme